MGNQIILWYTEKVRKEHKTAFLSAMILGLVCHIYKFVNYVPNHDSLYNFYSDQNVVGSGRWLLSIACGFSSYHDLPWLNGLLSLIFISLTSVVLVEIFKVKNPILITLISGLLVCSPSITETMFFGFTADGYMLAMLLSALSVYFSGIEDKKLSHSVIACLLICCACGIYQIYVSFSLILLLLMCMWNLLTTDRDPKEYRSWILRQVIVYAAAMALFYAIWKLCLAVENVKVNSYQGIDKMGVSLKTVLLAIPSSVRSFVMYFVEWNVAEHGWTLYGVLNVIFLLLAATVLVCGIVKTKLYKKAWKMILFAVCIAAIPFAACIWNFVSPDVGYRPMMLTGLALLYIFAAVASEKFLPEKAGSAAALLLAVIVFNNVVVSNICYNYMAHAYDRSYAMGAEIMARVHSLDTDSREIAVIGNMRVEYSMLTEESNKIHMLAQCFESNLLLDQEHVALFISNKLDDSYDFADKEKQEKIGSDAAVKNMGCWPAVDSVQVIDDTIVIKLDNEEPA